MKIECEYSEYIDQSYISGYICRASKSQSHESVEVSRCSAGSASFWTYPNQLKYSTPPYR